IHRRAWRVAVRNENTGYRRCGNSKLVDDFQIDFEVERGPRRSRLLSQQARRHGYGRRWCRRGGWMLAVDADHGEIIRLRDAAICVGSQCFLRHRIADVAADGHDAPWSNLGHDIAMGLHPWSDVVIGSPAAGPALANEITDLRCQLGDTV